MLPGPPRGVSLSEGGSFFEGPLHWKTVPRRTVRAVGTPADRRGQVPDDQLQPLPVRPYGCGRWHPKPLYWECLSVDDVAAEVPEGKMILLSFYGSGCPAGEIGRSSLSFRRPVAISTSN